MDLESTPATFRSVTREFRSPSPAHVPSGAGTAGVFYGKKTGPAASAACIADYPSTGADRYVRLWTELRLCSFWELIGTTI